MADKKIESFLNTVYDAAKEKSKKMISEIDRAGEASIREYKAELRRYADAERRREYAKAEKLRAENAAMDESEIKHVIFTRREAITDEVFAEIKRCLEGYCASSDYMASLVRDALSVSETITGEDAAILVKESDLSVADELSTVSGLPVRVDPSITIGGLRGVSSDMEIDCTLDTKFLLAREDFTKESGLSVI